MSAFQSTVTFSGEQSRVKLLLRKSYDVKTPAVGGELHGVLVDPVGDPVAGVAVRLGPYRVITDAYGSYAFVKMPPGEYDLSLDVDSLPASYTWEGTTTRVTINRTSRRVVNLAVVSLNAIHGRVYCDRNRNGVADPGEEVQSIVVRFWRPCDGNRSGWLLCLPRSGSRRPSHSAGSSAASGRLRAGIAREVTVRLTPDAPARGVDFRLIPKQKKILMQELSR